MVENLKRNNMTIAEKFYAIVGEPKEGELENYYYGLSNLTSEQQKQVEELLKEHLGFSKIEWMDLPAGLITNSQGEEMAIVAKTRLIGDTPIDDYKDRTCYFYQIVYSPVIYDPKEITIPVKDGMVISPLLYNPATFEPSRKITIEWKPEDLFHEKDIQPITWEDEKTYLREKLEALLANPEDFKPKGRRGLMLRFALDKTEVK
jgi:hypothetical protein